VSGLLPAHAADVFVGDQQVAAGQTAADGTTSIGFTLPVGSRQGLRQVSVVARGTAETVDCTLLVQGPAVNRGTSPHLATSASGSVPVGGTITDAAVISGGNAPAGTVSVNLFGPDDTTCSTPLATSMVPVHGNGSYPSAPFVAPSAGMYRWVANYTGDTTNDPAGPTGCQDPQEQVTVTKAPTTTTLGSSGNPSLFGQAVTLTASVAPTSGTGTPTGDVTLTEGSVTLGRGRLSAGTAQFALSGLSVGPRLITATYSGDANNLPSSGALIQMVNRAPTTLVAAPARRGPLSITFSATLTRTFDAVPLGRKTVGFSLAGRHVCSGSTNAAGVASCTVVGFVVGLNRYAATFAGDAQYLASNGDGRFGTAIPFGIGPLSPRSPTIG
jgi:hypothetical protein